MRFSGNIIKYFVLSRLLVIFSALVGSRYIPINNLEGIWNIQIPFFDLFARWDSAFYLAIAKSGYSIDSTWAFRPFFPLMMKVGSIPFYFFSDVDAQLVIAGFFLNAVFFLITLNIIYKLTLRLFSEKVANTTGLLIAFCPAAIFFSAIYTESLFLLLVAATFILIEKSRVTSSGISGLLAGLTRPEGIFVLIPIFIRNFKLNAQLKTKVTAIISCLIVLSSLLVILLIAWGIKGNPLIIFSVENQWSKITLATILSHPTWILDKSLVEFDFFTLPAIIISLFVGFCVLSKYRKNIFNNKFLPYFAYSISLLLFYLCLGDIRSITRFIWSLIPLYWGIAVLANDKRNFKLGILSFFILELFFGSILFANWYTFQ
jgi:hypothetical protein